MNVEAQIRRWSWRLKDLIRERGRTQRWIEQQRGWATGYMSHLLRPGPPALKVEHVLTILEVIDVSPRDFFFELYALASSAPGTVPFPNRPESVAREATAPALPGGRHQIDKLVDLAVRDARRRLRPGGDELRDLVSQVVREELARTAGAPARRPALPRESG
jgi:hypothetical protein